MPNNRWSTQNKMTFWRFFFLIFILKAFCIYIMVSNFVFLWDFYVCKWACLCIYVSFALSLAPFLLFVLSYSSLFLFYYYYLNVCFLIRKKRMYIRVGGEIGGSRKSWEVGRGTAIRIYYIKKKFIFDLKKYWATTETELMKNQMDNIYRIRYRERELHVAS